MNEEVSLEFRNIMELLLDRYDKSLIGGFAFIIPKAVVEFQEFSDYLVSEFLKKYKGKYYYNGYTIIEITDNIEFRIEKIWTYSDIFPVLGIRYGNMIARVCDMLEKKYPFVFFDTKEDAELFKMLQGGI